MSKFLDIISDISGLHRRAAFSDLPERIAAKESAFLTLAQERYTCRKFKDTAVSDVEISHIVEAGRLAPSAKNAQPVHVWVVKSAQALEKIGQTSKSIYGAPLVLIVGCKPEDAWVRALDGKNEAEVDAAIAATHMMLEATALELGSVWVGSFDPVKVHELFPETAGWDIVCLLPIGHPDMEPGPNHPHRKAKEEFVTEL